MYENRVNCGIFSKYRRATKDYFGSVELDHHLSEDL